MKSHPLGPKVHDEFQTQTSRLPEDPSQRIEQANDVTSRVDGNSITTTRSLAPKLSSKKKPENPIGSQAVGGMPGGTDPAKPSWVETAPRDIRLRVLSEVAKQVAPEAAQQDMASYAQTSKTANADLRDFHRSLKDPRTSLLDSRRIARDAWSIAKDKGPAKADAFQAAIHAAAAGYNAIHLDGRHGIAEYADLMPAAVTAVVESGAEYLHLRIGYPTYQADGPHDAAVASIKALGAACAKRSEQGKSMPEIFLQIDGMPIKNIAASLQHSPIKPKIVGLALCSHRSNAELEVKYPQKSFIEMLGMMRKESVERESWQAFLTTVENDLRYLDLRGWQGRDFCQVLRSLVETSKNLEELHVPMCDVTASSYSGIMNAIHRKPIFKCLAIDYSTLTDTHVPHPPYNFPKILNDVPGLMVVESVNKSGVRPVDVAPHLKDFWRAGRYKLDGYPQVMRDMPEIYSRIDFFPPKK